MSNPSPFDPDTETRYVEKNGSFKLADVPMLETATCALLCWSILSSFLLIIEILIFDSSDGLLCMGIILCVIIGFNEHYSSTATGDAMSVVTLFAGTMIVNGIITKIFGISYGGLLCVYLLIAGVILWRNSG